jgi:hypothetical protein
MIPVKPTVTYPTLSWITYRVTDLKLKESITFAINYYNDLEILIDTRTVHIVNEEYYAWGNDDDYIPAIIFYKLGLTYDMEIPNGVLVHLNNKYFNKVFGETTSFEESETLDFDEEKESLLNVSPNNDVFITGVNGWQILDLENNIIEELYPTIEPVEVFIKNEDEEITEYYHVKVTRYFLLYKVAFEVLEIL